MRKTRNEGIDILRLICAFLVVYIHNPIEFTYSDYFIGISRVAVPVFFMITGFYYESMVENHKEIDQLEKILKILLFATGFYLVFFFLIYGRHNNYFDWLLNKISQDSWIDVLFFNVHPLLHRLWYLIGLVFVLVIVNFFKSKKQMKTLKNIAIILFVISILIGPYSKLFLKTQMPEQYYRNFLFLGIPYFMLGYVLSFKQEEKMSPIICFLISILCSVIEIFLLKKTGLFYRAEFYLSTPLVAYSLFSIFKNLNIPSNTLSFVSRKTSSKIYIIHKAVDVVLGKISDILVNPFIIFVISFVGSLVLCEIDKIVLKFKK